MKSVSVLSTEYTKVTLNLLLNVYLGELKIFGMEEESYLQKRKRYMHENV